MFWAWERAVTLELVPETCGHDPQESALIAQDSAVPQIVTPKGRLALWPERSGSRRSGSARSGGIWRWRWGFPWH